MEKNLEDMEGIKKLKEMVKDARICMYTTVQDGIITSRPMTSLDVDDEGNVWFFTSRHTDIGEGMGSQDVTLIYSDPSANNYISVAGTAYQVEDEDKKEKLWNPFAAAWFPEGKNDPDLVMLKVVTDEAAYWDAGSSKMIVFFSMLKAAITGRAPQTGNHGKLNLA
ncbi:hypothetical protein DYBT9275_03181 [Dyadobacter sp. CECT 9275]|uniref:General stress protein FMN-binding split barrel domain-containing protein n=1 Tax=Dyadobacter helix TaxID=2822344 RepID=A0A916JDK3_9BACT|nr:pyridoxamine 5'-phosphate oxidase family protein [Dyadobacter sp. CECT 9275]CAG5003571.1 hypothetical protein DYBT9275_03181 [Dyadobacter sp. CECT 9275]